MNYELIEAELQKAKEDLEIAVCELDYLRWFYSTVDLGPADYDICMHINAEYERCTGRKVPKGYRNDEHAS